MTSHTQADMANAIRFLSADAVERAKSGHPGAPMGMAEIAQVLWSKYLSHNPTHPQWINRDRFVLSNGHGSMLLYALLHLSGYDVSIDDIQQFRQLHSKTAGHPECDITPGVETTTGPLGQGLGNAVGMALAEKLLADTFNREGHAIIDHYTYVFLGDGCLMEGISHEVCSLAGTLRLSRLIAFYDDNNVSIDGFVDDWFTDDTPARFRAYGWHVIDSVDGHDFDAIDKAIETARRQATDADGRPTLICCKTVIGKGAPNKQGTAHVHGAPLGPQELQATRDALGWQHPPFHIPKDIQQAWDAREAGQQREQQWNNDWEQYRQEYPELARELVRRSRKELPDGYTEALSRLYKQCIEQAQQQGAIATRKASQQALDLLAPLLPELFGGSADLTESNLTHFKGHVRMTPTRTGNHLSYGVREFGMSAIMNGMALHTGYLPYGGTFLTFSDYSRNALRMSALMKQRVVYVFTHDSIGLGEDGPTHQAVEHLPSLRIIPGLAVWRPCDPFETLVAWSCAVESTDSPTALILSRQAMPSVHTDDSRALDVRRGGYILSQGDNPQAVIIATGSEVGIALEAQQQLDQQGIATRVVSMPCTQVFDRQSPDYQQALLPGSMPVIVIEAAQPDFWYKYIARSSRHGAVLGVDSFGLSAPARDIYTHFGLTPEALCNTVKHFLA